ncbi:copia-type polyprotein, partial [Trifolium medium]|nr:copia-type polyprotein [Trifolium medium]
EDEIEQEEVEAPVRPQRTRQASNRLNDCEVIHDNAVNDEGELIHFALLADSEPIDFKEALKSDVWKRAMEEELKSIEKNQTWKLVNLLDKKTKIDVKWVFKVKLNPYGKISKHKARLVVALASKNRWSLYHLDVKSAFLNGPLEEEVFVSQLPGSKSMEQKN